VAGLPRLFADTGDLERVVFERITHGAVYKLYSELEDGGDRDERLASYVAAGRDPRVAMLHDIAALDDLSREKAAALAAKYLSENTPSVVTLKASAAKKRGDKLTIHAPIHDLGPRRAPVDPALASRAAQSHGEAARVAARTRTLPNGLKVILLPVTAVPTVDARLIFGAGTADEPYDERGVALFAAHALTWNMRHYRDLLAFASAGGMRDTDVGTDRTTFSVQGLDTNLDIILAGLRRWVRDGVYDESAQRYASTMHSVARRVDDMGPLTDAWRSALFGPQHPYVAAGLMRLANPAITLQQASAFRNAYYMPDNATLVISGRFDAAVADRWIDYLFADWQGHAAGHRQVAALSSPATVAKADDTTLVQVRLAIPVANTTSRAQHLVLAEMLNGIAQDVRFQLAASYTFGAQLAETRQASFLVVSGWVDAARTTDAVALVRDRIAELTADPTAAARAFVVAREHVAVRLRSRVGSAAALADRVEHDIELARDPLSDLNLASTVEALTISDMGAALHELDLSRATVLMDGPQDDVASAVKALGRTATYLAAGQGTGAFAAPGMTVDYTNAEQHVLKTDVEPSLTEQPMSRLMVAASVNAGKGSLSDTDITGVSIAGEVGYRYGWTNALGLRFELGHLTRDLVAGGGGPTTTLWPLDVMGLWHLEGRRMWGALMVGMHLEPFDSSTMSHSAPMYGVEGGYDLYDHGDHHVGVQLRWESASQGSFSYSSLAFGLTYRR
jgi:predicted Zn-dependent peptidase